MLTPNESRMLRRELRMSMQELAVTSGVTRTYISEWENGIRELSEERIRALERVLRGGNILGAALSQTMSSPKVFSLRLRDENGEYWPTWASITFFDRDGVKRRLPLWLNPKDLEQ